MRPLRSRTSLHVLLPAIALGATTSVLPGGPTAADVASDRQRQALAAVTVRAAATDTVVPVQVPDPPAPEPEPEPARPQVFASIDGVELTAPAVAPTAIGFHQANGPSPQALQPVGVPAGEPGDGPTFHLLPPRGRGTHPSSAVDIALPEGVPVTALVTGTVVDANAYALYGSTTDQLVTLRPDGRPDLLVRVLHIDGLQVEPGQRVVAGETVLAASSRQLPFGSQIDRVTGERIPHVHVEVVRIA